MRKLLPLIVIVILIAGYLQNGKNAFFNISEPAQSEKSTPPQLRISNSTSAKNDDSKLQQAFKNQQSDIQIRASGKVHKLLSDDLDGSRHQRFILKMNSGQTLLVAHNIDLADKIKSLKKGDTVEFYGEYEWNNRGGVIHWTHHDPKGRHIDGWLKHNGKTYQ